MEPRRGRRLLDARFWLLRLRGRVGQHVTAAVTSAVSTPSPVQTGIASTCDKYYLVASGDTCDTIAAAYNVNIDLFYAWNPSIGDERQDYDYGYYVCVAVTDPDGHGG